MRGKIITFAFVLVLALTVVIPSTAQTQSGGPRIEITGGIAGTCSNTGGNALTVATIFSNFFDASPHSYTITLTVPASGGQSFTSAFEFAEAFSGGRGLSFTPGAYSVPDNTPVNLTIRTYNGPAGGGGLSTISSMTFDCTTGQVISSYTSSFVMTTIICDTQVFETPGANPVNGANIQAGQTWFVNPIARTAPDEEQWVEIYIGNPQTVFIPATCVAGAQIQDQPTPRPSPQPQPTPIPGTAPANPLATRFRFWVEVDTNGPRSAFVPAVCVVGVPLLTEKPAGQDDFVLATIICDTALYDTPAGNPVGNERLRPGQTWFVNPVLINLNPPGGRS